jgi:phosphomethylpyrimidine synthase
MNANPKFLTATAHVDDAAIQPLPNSHKVYVGELCVPMREITQAGGNPSILVYDTSGLSSAKTRSARLGLSTSMKAMA